MGRYHYPIPETAFFPMKLLLIANDEMLLIANDEM